MSKDVCDYVANKHIGILGSAPLISPVDLFDVVVRINRGVKFNDADIWAPVSGPSKRITGGPYKYKFILNLSKEELKTSDIELHPKALNGTRVVWWFLKNTSPSKITVDGMPCFLEGHSLPRDSGSLQEYYYTQNNEMVSGKHYVDVHRPEIDRSILAMWHLEEKIEWLNI